MINALINSTVRTIIEINVIVPVQKTTKLILIKYEMQLLQHSIFIFLIGQTIQVFGWNEVEFVRAGSIIDFSKVINYDLRTIKINRTTYALSGNIQLLSTIDDVDLYMVQTINVNNGIFIN